MLQFFSEIIFSILQFPCCSNFMLYLHHQESVSATALDHPAMQNAISCCELCTYTLFSFIVCCVSQKMWLQGVFYIIFRLLRLMMEHSQPDRDDTSASGRWILLQHQQNVN